MPHLISHPAPDPVRQPLPGSSRLLRRDALQSSVASPFAPRARTSDPMLVRQAWRAVARTRRCALVTLGPDGERYTRANRMPAGFDAVPSGRLWVSVSRKGVALDDMRIAPRVRVEVLDFDASRSVLLHGRAMPLLERPAPVLLHPSIAADSLPMHAGEVDFALVCVEVDALDVEAWPPARPLTAYDLAA